MPFGDREVPWIYVSYCTKQVDRLEGTGFIIDDPHELSECGLYEPTRVMPTLLKGLPWSPSFFMRRHRDNVGPVIGHAPEVTRRRTLQIMPHF
ncbi:hypothetical protein DMY87_00900 [Rhizobium wuzhouense]|uniref:Uncharacterized protein n=1 Tax=Rhizobium wuzhouense TaxID=1986026 RepID=A0ABX5NZ74_9HYPH|nr:hypothetical protein DMY87_00900 [Rhizobium wuzhouense]